MRRTPIKPKRDKPRRNEGRVTHGRVKEKYSPIPNAQERRHEERLALLPCVGCGGVATCCHHLLSDCEGKRWRRDHRFQLPLCDSCHTGPQGVHGIGSESKWAEGKGIDVSALAVALWEESQ